MHDGDIVVFRIILYMSEQSLEFNRMPESQYIPDRRRVDTSLPAHRRTGTCAIYRAQTAYRGTLSERDLHRRR